MRASSFVLAAAIFPSLLMTPASALDDGHSLEAIEGALQSPIPDSVIEQASRLDDQILRTGTAPQGMKVSRVTDERLQRTQAVVRRVLVAIGENPQGWVVRVLDTDPKVVNAFVNGGKYIYVFSGLLAEVRSDNELAVVVGHEIGHSVLKHNLRRSSDFTSTLANLATVVGQIKGGSGGSNAMAVGKALHNGYSRDDEREADAFGVLAAWRAGFDPMGGAAFFTRLEQADEKANAADAKTLDDYKSQALVIKSRCETERQQWAAGQIAHTQPNVDVINQTCASYTQAANAYNAAMAQHTLDASQASMGDHPADQERVAAIAAETDWLHRARTLRSMQSYPRTYTVIVALVQTKSPIFAGSQSAADSSASTQSAAVTQPEAQREAAAAARDAQANADAAAASAAAIEAERRRLANARRQEMAVSYEKPKGNTPDARRESQF